MKCFLTSMLCFATFYSSTDAIMNGNSVPITEHPYVAQLKLPKSEKANDFCVGTVLSDRYVITASICLTTGIRVRVGATVAPTKGGDEGNWLRVVGGYTHHSIALLKLAQPLQFNEHVQPIKLAQQVPPVGSNVLALGFGDRFGHLSTLTKVETTVTDRKNLRQYTVDNAGLCSGDEGGPVIYNDELVGVIDRNCVENRQANVVNGLETSYNWIFNKIARI